jgi:hypothetical protein
MRNGIVHVEQIELLAQYYLVLFRGECQGIGEVIEERVPAHPGIDLMIEHPLGIASEPEG